MSEGAHVEVSREAIYLTVSQADISNGTRGNHAVEIRNPEFVSSYRFREVGRNHYRFLKIEGAHIDSHKILGDLFPSVPSN